MKIEFTHSAWKADILPLNYAHIKQDRKRKQGFSFHFRNLSLLSLRKTFSRGGLTTAADFWHNRLCAMDLAYVADYTSDASGDV